MSRIVLGIICGLVFGAIDIGIMLPMSFPDKKAAITAAFIARFGIGFVIGAKNGFSGTMHEARTDVSMLLGLIFLLLVGAGVWSLDAWLAGKRVAVRAS